MFDWVPYALQLHTNTIQPETLIKHVILRGFPMIFLHILLLLS